MNAAIRLSGLGLLAVSLSLGVQAVLLAAPLLTMHVYDGVLSSRSIDTLMALAIAYVVAVALGGLLRALRAALLSAMAERLARRMQFQTIGAALRRALLGDRTAGLLALSDAAEVRRMLGGTTLSDALDLVALPVALFMLFLLHPLYGWTALAGCLLLGLLGALADRTTRDGVRRAGAMQARCTADLAGRLRQSELLDCLGMLPAVLRRWQPDYLAMLEAQDAAQRRARALQGLSGFTTQMLLLAMACAGGFLVTRNLASPGSILAASLLAGMASAPGARLVAAWRDWAFGLVAFGRLRRTIAEDQLAVRSAQAGALVASPGLVIEGLTLDLPGTGRVLVRDLALEVKPGQMLLVSGPNGAGKTSLLRAILGLAAPADGCVLLDGQDTAGTPRREIGPRIGYLPQGALLLEGSVLENIARLGPAPAAAAIAAAREAGAHEAIGRLPEGYASGAGPSSGLSGGQRQGVAMARAVFGAPSLLVLDEPEAGLDATGIEGLLAAVAAAKARGAVVVLVTHQPGPWVALVDLRLRLEGAAGAWDLVGN
ncbi:ATP-binding cassette domain-containing protein [Falsiroseomonas sp. E2-1-a20]|uniref:ATP-binding cassette domain-containing protein n=1 Tax=Falsiroseomonas sp. E2-1-a20 TaxID=3239300 RepID=UPI003F325E9B